MHRGEIITVSAHLRLSPAYSIMVSLLTCQKVLDHSHTAARGLTRIFTSATGRVPRQGRLACLSTHAPVYHSRCFWRH